jgi:beta-glucosidase/6-phospho-beta-glucosidase/beta-galactosidase
MYSCTALFGVVSLFSSFVAGVVEGSTPLAVFPESFEWGLATAPAQTEDLLDDTWLAFAEEGNVAAWNNTGRPEARVNFWTNPEVDIGLSAKAGSSVFRMGVDWGRLCPQHPEKAMNKGVQNRTALARYHEIIRLVRASGQRVMLTLFHHAIPKWSQPDGGWTNSSTVGYFEAFVADVVEELGEDVSYWTTFNEPTVFAMMVYCSGIWPPGPELPAYQSLACMFDTGIPYTGTYWSAMQNIQAAHRHIYGIIKKGKGNGTVGVAHNVAVHLPDNIWDKPANAAINSMMNFPFIDAIATHLDFIGLNYYGKEITAGDSVAILPNQEYSESGRAIYPDGIVELLRSFHYRFNNCTSWNKGDCPRGERLPRSKYLPFFITENGIADRTDILRPAYIVEHLLGLSVVMKEQIPVLGYIHWTISDNWEWADGYCPMFGLASVDRSTQELKRTLRLYSYNLLKTTVKTRTILLKTRTDAWERVRHAIETGETRPFCRALDGKTSLNDPIQRKFADQDWRLTFTT